MRLCCRLATRLAAVTTGLALLVNLVHPVIHGTPLDSGMLDMLIAQLNLWAAQMTSWGSYEDVSSV